MIDFSISTLGWIKCVIEVDERRIKVLHSSDFGDGFQELINIFFWVYYYSSDLVNDEKSGIHQLIWRDDFNVYKWKIEAKSKAIVDLEIFELSDDDPLFNKLIIKFSVSMDELLKDIFKSLNNMLDLFGIVGFKKAWEVGNFPLAEYIELKAKYNDILLEEYNVFKDDDEGLKRIHLEEEIKILSKW